MSAVLLVPTVSRSSVAGRDLELLFRRAAAGDRVARETLCHHFLPLARRLAGRYRSAQEPFDDLVQVASVGLLGAIDRYDPQRGVHFAAFAIPTILGELKRHFRNTGWAIHVPRGAQELSLSVHRAAQTIVTQTGRPATPTAIAAYLEISIDEVIEGLHAGEAQYSVSLDAPATEIDEDAPPLVEILGSEEQGYGLMESRASLAVALERLPFLERRALAMRMSGDLRQIEIAQALGCSQMQVSRLLRRAADNLRNQLDPAPEG